LFGIIGLFGSFFLYYFAEYISNNVLEVPEAKYSVMILAPAIFFVSISSVIKGYFNGSNKIFITAKIQFIEQVLKTIFTIAFMECISRYTLKIEFLAAASNFATTMATFISFIYSFIYYKKDNNIEINRITYKKERILHIIKNILIISIPITIGSLLSSFGKTVDSFTVVRKLKNIVGKNLAKEKYGILASKIDTLVMLPLSFNSAISTSIIPEIAKYNQKNNDKVISKINLAIDLSLMIAIPSMLGLMVYSKQIFSILFPNSKDGYQLLKVASICVLFSTLNQVISSILQALGKNMIPVIASFAGLILKVICNFFLINNVFLEYGAIIGNLLSSILSFIIVFITLEKEVKFSNNIGDILKIIFSSFIMIFCSYIIFYLLIKNNINYKISSIITLANAVFFYVISLFVTKMINKTKISETQ
jgi:stage V sporulation protein B